MVPHIPGKGRVGTGGWHGWRSRHFISGLGVGSYVRFRLPLMATGFTMTVTALACADVHTHIRIYTSRTRKDSDEYVLTHTPEVPRQLSKVGSGKKQRHRTPQTNASRSWGQPGPRKLTGHDVCCSKCFSASSPLKVGVVLERSLGGRVPPVRGNF